MSQLNHFLTVQPNPINSLLQSFSPGKVVRISYGGYQYDVIVLKQNQDTSVVLFCAGAHLNGDTKQHSKSEKQDKRTYFVKEVSGFTSVTSFVGELAYYSLPLGTRGDKEVKVFDISGMLPYKLYALKATFSEKGVPVKDVFIKSGIVTDTKEGELALIKMTGEKLRYSGGDIDLVEVEPFVVPSATGLVT